ANPSTTPKPQASPPLTPAHSFRDDIHIAESGPEGTDRRGGGGRGRGEGGAGAGGEDGGEERDLPAGGHDTCRAVRRSVRHRENTGRGDVAGRSAARHDHRGGPVDPDRGGGQGERGGHQGGAAEQGEVDQRGVGGAVTAGRAHHHDVAVAELTAGGYAPPGAGIRAWPGPPRLIRRIAGLPGRAEQ